MANSKKINSTFVGLGIAAAVGLLTTSMIWVGSDHDVSSASPVETTSTEVQSQQPSSSPWSQGSSDPYNGSQLNTLDSPTPSGRDSVPDQTQQDPSNETVDSHTICETECRNEDQAYVIQSGDTLSDISTSFEVSVDAIAQKNNIADVNKIYTGSTLVIPVP